MKIIETDHIQTRIQKDRPVDQSSANINHDAGALSFPISTTSTNDHTQTATVAPGDAPAFYHLAVIMDRKAVLKSRAIWSESGASDLNHSLAT
jgi:hypothetical protein